jgi:diguanylate cyclase (GGDEF)-like protein
MKPSWKHIYPWIKAAVLNLDSVDDLLRQTVEKISTAYDTLCVLWVGVEWGLTDGMQIYGTQEAVTRCVGHSDFVVVPLLPAETEVLFEPSQTHQFHVRSLPTWFLEQQRLPQIRQIETGDWVIPVTTREAILETATKEPSPISNLLQFVLQLSRLQEWTPEELGAIEIICSQLGLAYSALYWRQRLEQSRQQAALVGRISRLLNSTLNPDEIVSRIVAELGYGLQCDRSILVDLRNHPVMILATWDHPERELSELENYQIDRDYWQNVVEMFMQGGASYLQIGLDEPDLDPLQSWLQLIGVRSVLLVPLFIQEEFFGAVALLSYQHNRIYLLDELQTVRQVADQAAIALTNAQHYQSLWHQQESLQQQNSTLQIEVLRDELTQLMNRRSLERELERLSTRAGWAIQPIFSVIVCDIDYFKLINDAHGHLVGDEVLHGFAQRLQSQLRRGTPAYRYGGEEFVIILTETPLNKAVDVAERLRQMIRTHPIPTKIGMVDATASFGVAQQDSRDQSAWDVLQRADRALYEAKRRGRDRVDVLKPG